MRSKGGLGARAGGDLDGDPGSLEVEGVVPESVLEAEEADVGAEGHLPDAVGVEVELVLLDVREVLQSGKDEVGE